MLLTLLTALLPVKQPASSAESSCVNAMVAAVALSGNMVKSQQKGEAELTLEQRKDELLNQYRSKPLVFLERYHVCALSSNVMC